MKNGLKIIREPNNYICELCLSELSQIKGGEVLCVKRVNTSAPGGSCGIWTGGDKVCIKYTSD